MTQVFHQTGDGLENFGLVFGRRSIDVCVAHLTVLVHEEKSRAHVITIRANPNRSVALQFWRRDHFAQSDAGQILALQEMLFTRAR